MYRAAKKDYQIGRSCVSDGKQKDTNCQLLCKHSAVQRLISDIKGLRVGLENYFADQTIHERHAKIAAATRKALTAGGIKLYLASGWANTVTVLEVPEGVTDRQILRSMEEDYGIMISGCFDVLAGKVVRIGHIGENCYVEQVVPTLQALQGTLEKLGIPVACDLAKTFLTEMGK